MVQNILPTPQIRIKLNQSSEFHSTTSKKAKTVPEKKGDMKILTTQTPSLSFQLKNNSIVLHTHTKTLYPKAAQTVYIPQVAPPNPSNVSQNKNLHLLTLINNDKFHCINYNKKLIQQNDFLMSKLTTQTEAINSLQNRIIDLKGSIRVHCRISPFSKSDLFNIISPTHLLGKYSLEIAKSTSTNKPKLSQVYYEENNAEIYDEIKDFTLSVFGGYNVSLFMYGQTGSGKTHTLFGDSRENGLIEHIVEDIYREKKERKMIGETADISISAIEIYNDKFRDLIEATKENNKGKNKEKVFVKSIYNFEATSEIPKNKLAVLNIIKKISKLKTTAATLLNDKSSRSHTIVRITLSIGESGKVSTLTLVDLAGSERINKSKASGVRLEEAKFINLSLSSLGLCINSLINKRSHIPYRNSILTQFLEKGIGGNSRSMFIVNLKIDEDSLKESENTMKFAGDLIKVKGKKIMN
eukprot:GAHX01001375.1.p1 GENE.GAHX01001375.1~~GAHX01001375.1.p1  ORF type:complete len:468 (-),score=95.12 GAHX01001375.1:6-1409(-)